MIAMAHAEISRITEEIKYFMRPAKKVKRKVNKEKCQRENISAKNGMYLHFKFIYHARV